MVLYYSYYRRESNLVNQLNKLTQKNGFKRSDEESDIVPELSIKGPEEVCDSSTMGVTGKSYSVGGGGITLHSKKECSS